MPLDVKNLTRQGSYKFERPKFTVDRGLVYFNRYFSRQADKVIYHLFLVSFFLLPVSYIFDQVGLDRFGLNFKFLSFFILALAGFLWLIALAGLKQKFVWRSFLLNKPLLLALAVFTLSSVLSGNLADTLGLAGGGERINLLIIFLGLGFIWLLYNFSGRNLLTLNSQSNLHKSTIVGNYVKLLLSVYLAGSSVLAIYFLGRYFFSPDLTILPFWLGVIAVNAFLLWVFSQNNKGLSKNIWQISAVAHTLILLLGQSNSSWLMLLSGFILLTGYRFFTLKARQRLLLPTVLSLVSLLFLLLPGDLFGLLPAKLNSPDFNSSQVVWQTSKGQSSYFGRSFIGRWQAAWLGAGAGLGNYPTARLALSELQPAPEVRRENLINRGFYQIFLDYGFLGSAAFLAFLILSIFFVWRWLSFSRHSQLESFGLTESLFIALLTAIIGLWFMPLTIPLFLTFVLLLGLVSALAGSNSVFAAGQDGNSWDLSDSKIKIWLGRGSLIALAIILAAVAVIVSRHSRAEYNARAAVQREGQGQAAVESWQRAVRLNSRSQFYKIELASAELSSINQKMTVVEQKRILDEAGKILSDLAAGSKDPYTHWQLARVYLQLARYADGSLLLARQSYQEALAGLENNLALPIEVTQFYRRGAYDLANNVLTIRDLQDEARQYVNRVLAIQPGHSQALIEMAFIIESQDGPGAALDFLLPWANTSLDIVYHLGRLYFNEGKYDLAKEMFQQVIISQPGHSDARYSLAVVYFRQGELEKSLAEFEEVLRLNPDSEDVRNKISEVSAALKKKNE